jgi:putative FmdB family regulatory protein
MPIYEYRCEACGARFEAWLRSLASAPPEKCPTCGAGSIKRLPALVASTPRASGGPAACGPSGST